MTNPFNTRSDFLRDGKSIPFIQAIHCGPGRPGGAIDQLVIHTMETAKKPGTAKNVALWLGGKTQTPPHEASVHYCVDDVDTIQCVAENVVAWAAPGGNRKGIHIEHAGYAAQTPVQWGDAYSLTMLEHSAKLAADICKRHDIPIVRLSVEDLKAGKRGLCGHVDITNAFKDGKGHTDPGVSFPWDRYLEMVHKASIPPTIPPAPSDESVA